MKDLLTTIVTALVSRPEMVRIDHHDQGNTVLLEIHVDPEDMGKVIGKQGKRAQAIRAIMKAKATKCDKRVIVDIV
ncbi:MAG: KH domain-containing protein [Clostridiaceae bacterium]|jgi:predicted RNA-binding protein YlqC (UPF0109 family)|nr:KH domain-containing protein [Clostridiaceae bacterium]